MLESVKAKTANTEAGSKSPAPPKSRMMRTPLRTEKKERFKRMPAVVTYTHVIGRRVKTYRSNMIRGITLKSEEPDFKRSEILKRPAITKMRARKQTTKTPTAIRPLITAALCSTLRFSNSFNVFTF
jgi:hypothetical protein